MKKSEARILRYLTQVDPSAKYTRMISIKLKIDYGYLIGLLHAMRDKGWITRTIHDGKAFNKLTDAAPKLPEEQDETKAVDI